ncbi:MAG: fluoride efflux transporter CrcB [Gammaproteobacteria bacterium]|jgi:CrcB protein|nr:fluoride efflux transporter CrcB [Gammaproteobacteria bacterium]
MSLRELLLVAGGGAAGSVLRYLASDAVQRLFPALMLPIGTLTVNVSGSLLIGLFAGLVEYRELFGSGARLLLVVGVLGGYTTFSAFSLETLALLRSGQSLLALLNVLLQLSLGIAAAAAGFAAARAF